MTICCTWTQYALSNDTPSKFLRPSVYGRLNRQMIRSDYSPRLCISYAPNEMRYYKIQISDSEIFMPLAYVTILSDNENEVIPLQTTPLVEA